MRWNRAVAYGCLVVALCGFTPEPVPSPVPSPTPVPSVIPVPSPIPVAEPVAQPADEAPYLQLRSFGISERFLWQPSYGGANLSTMLSWHPERDLSESWSATGLAGISMRKATDQNFFISRLQAGVAYQKLHPRLVPEIQAGIEIWARSQGGVYFGTAANLHYRIRTDDAPWIDSLWAGWQTIFVPSNFGNELVIGLRLSFPPRALPVRQEELASAPVPIPEPQPSPSPVAALAPEVQAKFAGKLDIKFRKASAVIDPRSYAKLDSLVATLKEFPDIKIELEGHSDDTGGERINRVTSQKRAEAARDYLVLHGIAPDRVRAVGYAYDRPAIPAKTDEARSANRRVQIHVLGGTAP